MNAQQADKKREKILGELRSLSNDWNTNNLLSSDPKIREKRKHNRAKIEEKAERLKKELFAIDAEFPPASDYSKDPKYFNAILIPVPLKYCEPQKKSSPKIDHPAKVADPVIAAPVAPSAPAPVAAVPAKKAAAPTKVGPSIPAGNRYAVHEELISKIARDVVTYCTEMTAPSKWYKGSSRYRIVHGYELKVYPGYIHIRSLQPDPRGYREIGLCRNNMKPVPDTQAFVDAIFPFVDAYFTERIHSQFRTSSIHVKPTIHNRADRNNSMFYLEVQEHHDADDSLKSW